MFKYFGDCYFGQGTFFHGGNFQCLESHSYRVGVMSRSIFTDEYKRFTIGELMFIRFGIFADNLKNIRVGYEDELDNMEYGQEAESTQGTTVMPVESLTYYPSVYKSKNAFRIMFICDCPKTGNFLLERIDLKIAVRRDRSATLVENTDYE